MPSEQNGKNPNSKCKMMIIKLTDEEHELLKRDAHAHNMNISEYIRYLVAKERKEMGEIERIRNMPSRECISREKMEKYRLVEERKEREK